MLLKLQILRKKDVKLLFTGKTVENFVFPKDLIPQYLRLLEKSVNKRERERETDRQTEREREKEREILLLL